MNFSIFKELLTEIPVHALLQYDALFLELLIPEWILAIYMQRQYLNRESAIEQIKSQKSSQEQSYEGYTTIMTTKLDDTLNNTNLSRM